MYDKHTMEPDPYIRPALLPFALKEIIQPNCSSTQFEISIIFEHLLNQLQFVKDINLIKIKNNIFVRL